MNVDPPVEAALSAKVRRLQAVSIAETVSFLALLAAMFMESEQGVSILGAIHGLLFLAYAFLVWFDRDDLGWTIYFALGSIVTGPVGAIIVLERLRREGAGRRTTDSGLAG